MAQLPVKSILIHFDKLFWICKAFGLYPYELKAFRQQQIIKKSKLGTSFVLLSMISIIITYNFWVYTFNGSDDESATEDNQTDDDEGNDESDESEKESE